MATSRSCSDTFYTSDVTSVLRVPSAPSRVRSDRSGSTARRSARAGTAACATTSAGSASAPPATSGRGTVSPILAEISGGPSGSPVSQIGIQPRDENSRKFKGKILHKLVTHSLKGFD